MSFSSQITKRHQLYHQNLTQEHLLCQQIQVYNQLNRSHDIIPPIRQLHTTGLQPTKQTNI